MDPYTTGPQPQPRRGRRLRRALSIAALMITAFVILVVIVAIVTSSHKTTATPAASTPGTAAPPSPAASAPAPSQTSSTPAEGQVGSSVFTVSTQDNSGNDVSYDITAAKILDPATGSDQYTTPDAGKRFVGVQFKITGKSGYSSDNANSDAVILGSDGQTYNADFNSISAGTNFNNGDFGVSAGRTQIGWVTFQLPHGVRVESVQWQADPFSDSPPAIWTN